MATAQTSPDRASQGTRPVPAAASRLPALVLAGGMAFLAGATDVYGLSRLHDLFVSFMSGNTTLLGRALGQGHLEQGGRIAMLVGLFVGGAAAGAALAELAGARRTAAVTALVALLLAAAALRPEWEAPALVLAMGALNAAISHVGPASVSLTYVTGTLVKFGQGLGKAMCGKGSGFSWLLQGPMWLSLLAGAAAAAWAQPLLGPYAAWPLPALAALLSLASLGADAGG